MRQDLEMPPPDCDACDGAHLAEANQAAWDTFWAVADLLGDGWGGVNLDNARLAAQALGHEWDEGMLARITTLVRIFLKKDGLPDDEGE